MNEKLINNIVWWIPIKSLRNDIRNILMNFSTKIDSMENKLIENNHKLHYLQNIIDKKLSSENTISQCKVYGMDFLFWHSRTRKVYDDGIRTDVEEYNLDKFDFKEGDIVIDIGANIGIVSIYLAKKFPFIKIYAFEPVRQNYECILKNIELNNISEGIITVENVAITGDRRKLNITVPIYNTGQSNIHNRYSNPILSNIDPNINSIKLDDIFTKYNINKCQLLKIDCEGAEYEILYNTNIKNLEKCHNLISEFHGNINEQKKLYEYCHKYVKNIFYIENTLENVPDQTRPDQTRPDQTRPDQTRPVDNM